MELHEKLQELRKNKGITQEEAAQQLYVSRTAISKWESGRGYPNIDSLKAIAAFYDISIDNLLSGEMLLTIAEENVKQNKSSVCDTVFGLLDISLILLFVLPIFGQTAGEAIHEVPLASLLGVSAWLKGTYLFTVIATVLWGILTIAFLKDRPAVLSPIKTYISLALSIIATFLFMVSKQPNAAAIVFVFLIIKAFLVKKQ